MSEFVTKTYSSLPGRGDAPAGIDSSQWNANPYATFDYRKTWWQKLWEGLGFRSKFDEYRDSMALNAREYDAQLAEKAHNEEYDSPLAQAQRMAEAGLNPDLQNISGGESSAMQPDPNAPIAPGFDDPMQILGQFSNMIMSGLTGAVGLANNITGLLGNIEDVGIKQGSRRDSIIKSAMDFVYNRIPDVYPSMDKEGGNIFHNGYFEDLADSYIMDAGMSHKDARLFARTIRDFVRSAPASAEAYKQWYERGKARTSWNEMYASGLFSESDEVMRAIINPIVKAYDRLKQVRPDTEEAQLKAAQSEAGYTQDYYDSLDGELAGKVVNSTNRRNLASTSIDTVLNEALDEIIHNLKDKSESGKRGHGLSTAAILIFALMRMTNFNIGATPKGVSAGIGF